MEIDGVDQIIIISIVIPRSSATVGCAVATFD